MTALMRHTTPHDSNSCPVPTVRGWGGGGYVSREYVSDCVLTCQEKNDIQSEKGISNETVSANSIYRESFC